MKHQLTYLIHCSLKFSAVNIASFAAIQVIKHAPFGSLGIQTISVENQTPSPRANDNMTLMKVIHLFPTPTS